MRNVIIITVLLVILVGIGGFYLGTLQSEKYLQQGSVLSETPSRLPTKVPTKTPAKNITGTLSPETVAQNYFDTFITCTNNPPPAAKGQVSIYCQDHNEFGGSELPGNLAEQAKNGFVPVLCAPNKPISAKAIIQNTSISKSTVGVTELFKSNQKVNVTYLLTREAGEWKVQNIACPKPL